MLDNLKVIPEGTPEAISSVANNLIDKISNAVGYVFVPKGKKKDVEYAVEYLINEIKDNKSMPPLAKAATISNARKIIKQYANQNGIIDIALNDLSYNAEIDKIDDDWLSNFMDKAGNVSNEDVQVMFGKLLAEECNKSNSVSKTLINILASMDAESANAFKKLRRYMVLVSVDGFDKREPIVVIPDINEREEYSIKMCFEEFIDLTSLGLIEYTAIGGYEFTDSKMCFEYGNKAVTLASPEENISLGSVGLTRAGKELANIILLEESDDEYFQRIINYWKERKIEVEVVSL